MMKYPADSIGETNLFHANTVSDNTNNHAPHVYNRVFCIPARIHIVMISRM